MVYSVRFCAFTSTGEGNYNVWSGPAGYTFVVRDINISWPFDIGIAQASVQIELGVHPTPLIPIVQLDSTIEGPTNSFHWKGRAIFEAIDSLICIDSNGGGYSFYVSGYALTGVSPFSPE